MKKVLSIILVLCLSLSVLIGCTTIPAKPGPGEPTGDDDYGNAESWAGDSYKLQDLGTMNFDAIPDDYAYDWGFTTIFKDGIYKIWWVRPSLYDSIWYAESTDMKNFTNVQRVITLSPNSTTLIKYDTIKGMVGKPNVLFVENKYYMYFEAPATEDTNISATIKEWDNQVFLATSDDGVKWDFYMDENNQPKPVIAMPKDKMNNPNKYYGVGQPSVFYKDGQFYVSYCYVIENFAEIRIATSSDGKNFGDTSTHTKIAPANGAGVKYNALTKKYIMINKELTQIIESADPLDWSNAKTFNINISDSIVGTNRVYHFPEIVANEHGQVQTESYYVTFLDGEKSTTADWRENHTTWDGHVMAFNPCEYTNRPVQLPNGKKATETNLKEYRDNKVKLGIPEANAIYMGGKAVKIDGVKDEAYSKATKIEVNRAVYNWGSNLTPTKADAYFGWDEDYIYAYIEVSDAVVSYSNNIANIVSMYKRDSVDIFVDVPNDHTLKNEVYGLDQYVIATGANNQDFMIKGSQDYDLTSEFNDVTKRVKRIEGGYCIELKVEWYQYVKEMIAENVTIGLDIQINDDMGMGDREALVVWSDHTGNAFRYVDKFGELTLIK